MIKPNNEVLSWPLLGGKTEAEQAMVGMLENVVSY